MFRSSPSRWLFVALGCCTAFSSCDSEKPAAPRPTPASLPSESDGKDANAEPDRERIWIVLDAWKSGRRDEAVATLRTMSRENAPDADYRPYSFSEHEFVARAGAQWQARQKEMMATGDLLREITREIDARAAEARKAGKYSESRALLSTLKQLGAANRGPEVPLLSDALGAMMEKTADKGLSVLDGTPVTPSTRSSAP